MNGQDPPPIPYGIRHPGEEAPDLLQTGLSVLRLTGASIGLLAILIGLVLAYSVFSMVKDMVTHPETLTGFLDQWESNMSEKAPPAPMPMEVETPPVPAPPAAVTPESAAPAPESALAESPPAPPRNAPVKTKPLPPPGHEKSNVEIWVEIVHMLRSGTFARPVGAIFILLLVGILVRIPMSLMLTGSRILGLTGLPKPGEKAFPKK